MNASGAARWLSLAAAPTFALMALVTGLQDAGPGAMAMICSGAPGGGPLSGMVVMYLLKSGFHAAPWLRLMAERRPAP